MAVSKKRKKKVKSSKKQRQKYNCSKIQFNKIRNTIEEAVWDRAIDSVNILQELSNSQLQDDITFNDNKLDALYVTAKINGFTDAFLNIMYRFVDTIAER